MDTQVFQDKRQGLIGLTEALTRVEGIEACTMTRAVADVVGEEPGAETVPVAREVKDLLRKLREDQFRIALVAPFQSGKSTTFDALLGGEEVSPRGDNTSTSATIVHGRHTADPALAGKAEVAWKNDAELLLMLPEKLLAPRLADLAPERFGAGATLDDLRLGDPRDLELLRQATAREWARYREKPRGYRPENLDRLRIAYVMVRHYGNAHLRGLQARQGALPMEEVEPLVRFPSGWERRFDLSKPEPEPFEDAETVFLFVKKVTIHVDAPALAALGCSVVDCPGLFANRYDTSVTLEELGNCDVAWVLLGATQVTSSELKQIKAVAQAKPGAMVFALNMKPDKPRHVYEEKILPNDVARLNQTLPTRIEAEADILLYQARLALVAVQAERLRAGTLSAPTQAQIMRRGEKSADEDDPFESPLAVLEEFARGDLESLGVLPEGEAQDVSLDDPQGLATARREGGLDAVVEALQRNVVANRGRIILKTNGSDRLRRAVDALRSDTERHVKDLREGLAAAERRAAEKQKRLDAYVRVCDEQFAALANTAGLAADLEEEFLERVAGPTQAETLKEALDDVAILVGKRQEALQAWLGTTFRRILGQNLQLWAFDMRDGKSEAFEGFRKQLATIQRKVEVALKWESPLPDDGGFAPSAPDIRPDIEIGLDWGKIIGIVADIVAVLPIPGGKFLKLLKGARFVAAAILKIVGKTLPTQEEKLAQALRADLPEALAKACRDYAEELSAAWAKALFGNAQAAIRAAVEARRRDLEADLAQVREELGRDRAAREQTLARLEATLAQVRPIDARLAAFEAELARLLG